MSVAGHRSSPASAPLDLDDYDLLSEILLRLPPQPSSLPRASLVCTRWRRVVSDRAFARRFRLHHRNPPPLLGYFFQSFHNLHFQPTLEAPNRIPPERFHMDLNEQDHGRCRILGCRHGLALIYQQRRRQILVWDPVNGDRNYIDVHPRFEIYETPIHGAVLRRTAAAGAGDDENHFQVVLVGNDWMQPKRALACVYSSETGAWGRLVSTLLPPEPMDSTSFLSTRVCTIGPAVMIGDSLYWPFSLWDSSWILEFHLGTQSLAVMPLPPVNHGFTVMRAEGGGLGLLLLSDLTAQFWKRNADCGADGASWVLGKTVDLGELLPVDSKEERWPLRILGLAEDHNVALLWTYPCLFTVQLDSLQFRKLFQSKNMCPYHPFEAVYTAGI